MTASALQGSEAKGAVGRLTVDGRGTALAALGYIVLVVYASLYPFSGWVAPPDPLAFLLRWHGTQVSLGDLVTNVVAYVPVGLLVYRFLRSKARAATAAGAALAAAFALSLSMELLQAFLPTRVQSTFDLLTNTLGGACGVMAAGLLSPQGVVADTLRRARANWLVRGHATDVGLIALGAWGLSRLMPLVPSIDVGKFRRALAPLAHAIADPHLIDGWRLLGEVLTWAGLALVARSLVRPEKPGFAAFSLAAAAILLAQIPIVGKHLSPETLVGCAAGLLLAKLLGYAQARTRANLAFVLIFAGFCIAETLASHGGPFYAFNWIPFRRQMANTLVGIDSLLETIGLAAALAWAAHAGAGPRAPRWTGWAAGILATGGTFALELNQSHLQGRVGDVTTPLVVALTFGLAWRAAGLPDTAEAAAVPAAALAATPAPARLSPPTSPSLRVPAPGGSLTFYALALSFLTGAIWFVAHLPSVNYNVRQLLYPGHPIRSAALLATALLLTLAVPAGLVAWVCRRRLAPALLPLALLANALLAWLAVVNAVPSRNLHDIVGAPVLHWPDGVETCLRFVALHAAVTVLVTAGVVIALALFQRRRVGLAVGWILLSAALGPLFYWVIVTQAATDNLTELMRDGGSATASILLALGALLSFLSGSIISAAFAFRRRIAFAFVLAALASLAAYRLFVAGSETVIIKYGRVFSAMQFLLSPDRAHYVGQTELIVRYGVAYVALLAALALLQYRVWAIIAAESRRHDAALAGVLAEAS